MANKQDRFYFENFAQAAEKSYEAALYLENYFKNYNYETLGKSLKELHTIEHEGDRVKHRMSAALAKAFVTPVDREDLDLISHDIDDVTDCLEDILQLFYIDDIKTVLPEAIIFAEKLVKMCDIMKKMLAEFINFKKPAKLHEFIVELSNMEEQCDKFYIEAVKAVPSHCTDVLEIMYWREIYKYLEDCADACEHVGDSVETVVMKNT